MLWDSPQKNCLHFDFNIPYVGDGEDFSVYAARESDNNWCVLVDFEPPANAPDDWVVTASCATPENFAARGPGSN